MTVRFQYGSAQLKDLTVVTEEKKDGKTAVKEVKLKGESLQPTSRFWHSLHLRFGFNNNIFRYFSHAEVFKRISSVTPDSKFNWCVERNASGNGRLLAVSSPNSAQIHHDDLMHLLKKSGAEETNYDRGVVRSVHSPRTGGSFQIGGDAFKNKFIIDTPIDGFGRPTVYLSLLRLICSNGAIGYSPAFRSEVSVGRKSERTSFALVRILDGFNNEEGFAALRQRFESATQSWASVNEVNKLYKMLIRLHHNGEVDGRKPMLGTDGAEEIPVGSPILKAFRKMTGDLSQVYGMANLDALSVKRQRTLPVGCKVYDLLNFTSETATHHATTEGNRTLQAFLGDLISSEYDLEGTVEHFDDWKDFFIGNADTTETVAEMDRLSK